MKTLAIFTLELASTLPKFVNILSMREALLSGTLVGLLIVG